MRQFVRSHRYFSRFLVPFALATTVATVAPAQQTGPQDVIWLLRSEGYEITDVGRTWLGRIRIEATNGANDREVIISRSTGEIRYDQVYSKQTHATDTADGGNHGN
ncbi:MAG: hypothetical protein AAFQ79_12740 [Pseudomonadota bacterium]